MDGIDQHILALLAAEGRMSFTDIGRATGLSTSAAQQRVRRLEQRGILVGYHAQIDPAALGLNLTAFISVRPLGPLPEEDIAATLRGLPQIVSCFAVAGDASFLCMAEVGTPMELDDLLTAIRGCLNVTTVSTVVLRTLFRDRPLIQAPDAGAQVQD